MTSRTWSRVSGHRMISKLEGDGTEGSLGWANEGSQAVLTANADESEPELAWADPRWRDLRRSFRHWRSTEPQHRLHRGHHFPAHAPLWLCPHLHCWPGSFNSACYIKSSWLQS